MPQPVSVKVSDFDRDKSRLGLEPGDVKFGGFERLLNLREAASVLEMHWKTLEGMARKGRVPALKVGKRWKFRLSSLNRWLDDQLNSTTTDRAVLTGQEQHP
jgi:excisionase family DNA binding protein